MHVVWPQIAHPPGMISPDQEEQMQRLNEMSAEVARALVVRERRRPDIARSREEQ